MKKALATFWSVIVWAGKEIWEKINLPAVWREMKALGKKHGRRFLIAAVIWELIEDGLFPFLSWCFGVPELIPLFLIFHFEPIAYPAIFWLFRCWDRKRGRIPEHPDRSAHSASWRSWAKVVIYMTTVSGWFATVLVFLGLSLHILAFFAGLMVLFGYIHERIWHDSNYGIDGYDQVAQRRNMAKSVTYRIVSFTVMVSVLGATVGAIPWVGVLIFQGGASIVYCSLETVWSKSEWGIEKTVDP